MSQKVAGTKSCEVANFSGRKKEVNVAGIKRCEFEIAAKIKLRSKGFLGNSILQN